MAAALLDQVGFSRRIGGMLNVGKTNSVITDALVAANATLTLLKAAIAAAIVRPDDVPIGVDVNDALDGGKALGLFSETHSQTTVAGLVALTDASANFRQGLRA